VRVALTIAAIALSVSLVVSVTSGYASAESAAYKFLSMYMGSHDAQLTRTGDLRGGIRESICNDLLADPDVKGVTRRLEMESGLLDLNGKPILGRPASVFGISRPEDKRVENQEMQEGHWFDTSSGNEAVIDQAAARIIKTADPKNVDDKAPALHVGDEFTLPAVQGNVKLKVVGIVHKPAILASLVPTIYVPLHTLQKFTMPEQEPEVTRVLVDLNESADAQKFADRWRAKLADKDPFIKLRLTSENRSQLDQNLQGLHMLSYLGGMVSMTAATFIVLSSLSMGVSERQRTLAMLRAIGAFRSQLGLLVLLEGLILSAIGIAIGIPLGMLWTKFIVMRFPELFAAGMTISKGGVLMASLGSLGAAVLASFLPAWAAMRVSPLEAMTPLAAKSSMLAPVLSAIGGLILISFDPILMFGHFDKLAAAFGASDPAAASRQISFYGHFVLGLPGVMIGYFLLAPMFVLLLEKIFAPIIAAMFGIRYAVLRQQLSGGIWRAAGTCAALMVGLSILVVLQVQGNTMLNGWQLPDKFPDIFIVSFKFGGMNQQEQEKLKDLPGIRNHEVMPIAIAAPEFGSNIFSVAGAAVVPDATMFFGVNPEQALHMMQLDFRQGTPEQAVEMLKKGRHLIVTQEFHELKGLNVGDKIPLKTPKHGVVDYTIAGIVWSPGIDVIVSMFDMGRQFDQRTAASVFGTLEDAREDFGVNGVYLFAANLELGVDKETVMKDVKQAVGAFGMRAGDIRKIKYEIQKGFGRILLLVSTVAFCAMGVASLGVTNTIMASIRSRRWQFGILRSIGVTRGQLLRMVLAEALLLGIVGCGLGWVAGLQLSVDAHQLSKIILGYDPPVTVPWGIIIIGTAIVLLIALIASIMPATTVARTEPLELLQAGRASM
jgi:putative ABC transport system permease protein